MRGLRKTSNLQDFPIICYKFMKSSELLHFMGYVDQALVLDKASAGPAPLKGEVSK